MIELRFYPNDILPSPINSSDATGVYITQGQTKIDSTIYDVITISMYFKDNLAIGLGGLFPYSQCLGYHPNDIETISIYSTVSSPTPTMVYFSAHSYGQGLWVPWEDCTLTDDGSLVVYVANHSHACYPWKGRYTRIYGFANDVCSDKGHHMKVNFQDMTPSYDFSFDNGIHLSKSLRRVPPQTSITSFQRCFLPFYTSSLRQQPSAGTNLFFP